MKFRDSNPARFLEDNKLFLIAIGLVLVFHGALLPFTAGNTYDAYIHMFFGDSYARSWFDPWEPRWYTGFTTTSYPPGTHMAIALFMQLFGLYGAFVVVMLVGLATLTLGIYRFSLLFVSKRASGYAAIFAVISSGIVETVHLFGQLPTIFSLGLFLNAMPHTYKWLVKGRLSELFLAIAMASATTAAHHVTTLFGTILFIGPVGLYSWLIYLELNPGWKDKKIGWKKRMLRASVPLGRGIVLGVCIVAAIGTIVFPYWYWSVTDPITQVSIPHGSRESFVERLDLGLVFFVIPWGLQIFFLPYVLFKAATSRMWPLALSVLLCLVLGTGGTTPISKAILGPAFDILTLDRFTFWATILVLPFTGALIESLFHGQFGNFLNQRLGQRLYVASTIALFAVAVLGSVLTATLSTFRAMQPDPIDPAPIVKFMGEDKHDRWRYLTLGFGDQFAFISAQMSARSIDGNYHSARRLPEMTSYAVERLENSKYLGVAGLGSLQQFLVNSDRYHLKFVFSNDQFYDPLLHFSGWNRLLRLSNGVVVWEKPDVTPLPTIEPRKHFPVIHMLMWGLLPPIALLMGYACILVTAFRRVFDGDEETEKQLARSLPLKPLTRRVLFKTGTVFAAGIAWIIIYAFGGVIDEWARNPGPKKVLEQYYEYIDFVRFEDAFSLIDKTEDLDFESYMLNRRWVGGILASYAKLTALDIAPVSQATDSADWRVTATYLTPFHKVTTSFDHHLVKRDGKWKIIFEPVSGYKPTERIQIEPAVSWNRPGRRTPKRETIHKDILDRPVVSVADARLIRADGKYRLIGVYRNEDVDPAAAKAMGFLVDRYGNRLAGQQSGVHSSHRLLPGQTGFFSVDFEGILALDDAQALGAFDPELYIPPELPEEPRSAELQISSTVNEENHYTGLSMSSIEFFRRDGRDHVSVMFTNTGTEQVEIAQLQYALFDTDGRIVNVGSGFLERDLKPGQSRRIDVALPFVEEIDVLHDLQDGEMKSNNRSGSRLAGRITPEYFPGYVPLDPRTGYSGISLNFSTMNFNALF